MHKTITREYRYTKMSHGVGSLVFRDASYFKTQRLDVLKTSDGQVSKRLKEARTRIPLPDSRQPFLLSVLRRAPPMEGRRGASGARVTEPGALEGKEAPRRNRHRKAAKVGRQRSRNHVSAELIEKGRFQR